VINYDESNGLEHNGAPLTLKEARACWRENTLQKWEEEWAKMGNSQWTHSLFPTVGSRLKLRNYTPNFWTTQAITNHSVFRGYLASRGRIIDEDKSCPCGFGTEMAEHCLLECPSFTDGRPMDWSEVTNDHLQYMRRTVVKLWEIENPHFTLRNVSKEE